MNSIQLTFNHKSSFTEHGILINGQPIVEHTPYEDLHKLTPLAEMVFDRCETTFTVIELARKISDLKNDTMTKCRIALISGSYLLKNKSYFLNTQAIFTRFVLKADCTTRALEAIYHDVYKHHKEKKLVSTTESDLTTYTSLIFIGGIITLLNIMDEYMIKKKLNTPQSLN